ncbi:MAG: FHA domain-containing protein [Anaerolineales bacterium]|nr:FHA domain-containing protein [Anaerolineales bacterium]
MPLRNDTSTINLGREKTVPVAEEGSIDAATATSPPKGIAIYLAGDIKPIAVMYEDEFILGRGSEGNEEDVLNETIIDLRLYGALEKGVSRRHLMIRRSREGYEAIDLGSMNGTFIYEKWLAPHQPYPLYNGTLVRMGNFRLLVAFRDRPKS